jgi:adenine-specific DNA-methyltransferase
VKGFVPTPPQLVDVMVERLFAHRKPSTTDSLLDPGCGTGAFIAGVLRWCRNTSSPIPQIVGIDSDAALLNEAKRAFAGIEHVKLQLADFLSPSHRKFDFVIGNPPYVSIEGLDVEERTRYKQNFLAARGRFDLYLLFFEQALHALKPGARLVFVTPEKFLYVQTASALRKKLATFHIEEIELIDETAFEGLVTYPTITTVCSDSIRRPTRIRSRDGTSREADLNTVGLSWLPEMHGSAHSSGPYLQDLFARISCGVATGADSVFVVPNCELTKELRTFAHPTISGRQMISGRDIHTSDSMLVPYDFEGRLLGESDLGELKTFLRAPARLTRLMNRTCTRRKPWYAFHENPPMRDLGRPKILCKDIGQSPWFVVDRSGQIIPRHSVYYLVPREPTQIDELCNYLNSPPAREWLVANCQRASNGFLRLQSHVLKCLPVPDQLMELAPV